MTETVEKKGREREEDRSQEKRDKDRKSERISETEAEGGST